MQQKADKYFKSTRQQFVNEEHDTGWYWRGNENLLARYPSDVSISIVIGQDCRGEEKKIRR